MSKIWFNYNPYADGRINNPLLQRPLYHSFFSCNKHSNILYLDWQCLDLNMDHITASRSVSHTQSICNLSTLFVCLSFFFVFCVNLHINFEYVFGINFWKGTFFEHTNYTYWLYVISWVNMNCLILNIKWNTTSDAKPLSDSGWRKHMLHSQLSERLLTYSMEQSPSWAANQ